MAVFFSNKKVADAAETYNSLRYINNKTKDQVTQFFESAETFQKEAAKKTVESIGKSAKGSLIGNSISNFFSRLFKI